MNCSIKGTQQYPLLAGNLRQFLVDDLCSMSMSFCFSPFCFHITKVHSNKTHPKHWDMKRNYPKKTQWPRNYRNTWFHKK